MAKKKTAAELRAEAKRLLKLADEVEKKERLDRALRVYSVIERYLHDNPTTTHIPVEIVNQARGQ